MQEAADFSAEFGESVTAKTEDIPRQKETAVRAPKRTGFEPAIEEAGSMADLQAEEKQNANQKIVQKKDDDRFLRRDKQRGVSYFFTLFERPSLYGTAVRPVKSCQMPLKVAQK